MRKYFIFQGLLQTFAVQSIILSSLAFIFLSGQYAQKNKIALQELINHSENMKKIRLREFIYVSFLNALFLSATYCFKFLFQFHLLSELELSLLLRMLYSELHADRSGNPAASAKRLQQNASLYLKISHSVLFSVIWPCYSLYLNIYSLKAEVEPGIFCLSILFYLIFRTFFVEYIIEISNI